MTRIYLIRHCEAEGNLYRRAQGHWNGKITQLGEKQIDALAERLRDVRIDAVWSSDLSRAMATADAALRGRGLTLCVTPRLREICMGVWEGQPWGELEYRWSEQMWNFNNDPAKWSVPGSESFADCQKRLTDILGEIAAGADGKTVAVFSHGMAIKIFLMGVLGMASGDPGTMMHGDNTSVSLLEYDNGSFRVVFYNDNSHLDGKTSTFARQEWWRKEGPDLTSLRFQPMLVKDRGDAALYTKCYADSWRFAHGSERGFVPNIYLSSARNHARSAPESLMKVMSGSEFAGIIELDQERGKREGIGWISLLYLCPEFRSKGLGVQLIGYAAAYYEKCGRTVMRLHTAVTNRTAIEFYKHYGFTELGINPGVSSDQLLMEKKL